MAMSMSGLNSDVTLLAVALMILWMWLYVAQRCSGSESPIV